MAARDPNRSARLRLVEEIKQQRRALLDEVLEDTGMSSEASLNATIGSKHDEFFDLKHDLIPDHATFRNQWLVGLKAAAKLSSVSSCADMWRWLKKYDSFKEYLALFLKGSYFKHYDELSKNRPHVSEAILWIGQNNASYGLAVTPRFKDGQWENDKSEIRAFDKIYFTIGHVLETGLVIPGEDDRFTFNSVKQYLTFFKNTLVRNSGSPHERAIAGHYVSYVNEQDDPELVPLMIPEFRYGGLDMKHVHRLDFLIIDPYTFDKVGIELSPWSTHGELKKIKGLKQTQINALAKANFEKEMLKHKNYYKKHNVFCLIYTDSQLKDTKKLFEEDIVPLLTPEDASTKIDFQVLEEFGDE